jgi:hypothetical protein
MPPEASLDEKVTRLLSEIGYSSDEAKEIARKVVECIEKSESEALASKSGSDEGFASSNKAAQKTETPKTVINPSQKPSVSSIHCCANPSRSSSCSMAAPKPNVSFTERWLVLYCQL